MPRRTKDTIRYTTPLERFDGRFAWWYVEFPHDTEQVFGKRGSVRVKCLINGEERQNDSSANLIFDIPYLVSYLSSICTLEAGDLIFTGTPDGVGMARGRLLKDGDVIDSGAEVIGSLRNRCVNG